MERGSQAKKSQSHAFSATSITQGHQTPTCRAPSWHKGPADPGVAFWAHHQALEPGGRAGEGRCWPLHPPAVRPWSTVRPFTNTATLPPPSQVKTGRFLFIKGEKTTRTNRPERSTASLTKDSGFLHMNSSSRAPTPLPPPPAAPTPGCPQTAGGGPRLEALPPQSPSRCHEGPPALPPASTWPPPPRRVSRPAPPAPHSPGCQRGEARTSRG